MRFRQKFFTMSGSTIIILFLIALYFISIPANPEISHIQIKKGRVKQILFKYDTNDIDIILEDDTNAFYYINRGIKNSETSINKNLIGKEIEIFYYKPLPFKKSGGHVYQILSKDSIIYTELKNNN